MADTRSADLRCVHALSLGQKLLTEQSEKSLDPLVLLNCGLHLRLSVLQKVLQRAIDAVFGGESAAWGCHACS